MDQDLFQKLPPEIAIDILSRLPARTVACCKCVCKPWLHLVETREFFKSHLSKSVHELLVLECNGQSEFYEFEDDLDLDVYQLDLYQVHYNPVTKLSLPHHGDDGGNISDGRLILLTDKILEPDGLFICNQITREYIKLECTQEFVCSDIHGSAPGFGVCEITGEYKVVRISHDCHKIEDIGHLKFYCDWWDVE